MNKIALALLAAMLSASTASALVIKNDPGGNLGARQKQIKSLLESGEPVKLVGTCVSSCTLILSLPPSQLCATKEARLGFHAMMRAASSGSDKPLMIKGNPVLATPDKQEWYMVSFAEEVKDWLRKSGALTTAKVTYVPATKFIRSCDSMERVQFNPGR